MSIVRRKYPYLRSLFVFSVPSVKSLYLVVPDRFRKFLYAVHKTFDEDYKDAARNDVKEANKEAHTEELSDKLLSDYQNGKATYLEYMEVREKYLESEGFLRERHAIEFNIDRSYLREKCIDMLRPTIEEPHI